MDFFGHQDAARRKSRQLIWLFAGAVIVIVFSVYTITRLWLAEAGAWLPPGTGFFEPVLAGRVAFLTLAIIFVGSIYKTLSLHQGGRAIASLLGGQELQPNSVQGDERRLLNVVEEMALASGVPVPSVFLLEDDSINAFAAGFSPAEAVIGVTRGTVQKLNRDELQGVIAHEFSHILNGDMRLNLRLVGVVHGILVIALIGRMLLRFGGESRKNGLPFLAIGLALLVIGSLGVFFGRMIKAALSRQREFLADASAVQFTRNPHGLAGALAKVGETGSRIGSAHAEEASHFFFADGLKSSFLSMLATHPPVAERVQRLDPSGEVFEAIRRRSPAPTEKPPGQATGAAAPSVFSSLPMAVATAAAAAGAGSQTSPGLAPGLAATPGLAAAAVVDTVGQLEQKHMDYARELMARLPAELVAAVREPLSAQAVVLGLLFDRDPAVRQVQSGHLTAVPPELLHEIPRLLALVQQSPPETRLPLLDLAMPALGRLSPAQYRAFAALVENLVAADSRLSLFELALQRALLKNLGRRIDPQASRPAQIYGFGKLEKEISVLLSALAHAGDTNPQTAFDHGSSLLRGFGQLDLALLPRDVCDLAAVDQTLRRLDELVPKLKKPLLGACAATVAADRAVAIEEAELLRVIADTLGCPVPPLLAGQKAA